jgi:hypothetical protein
LGSRKRQRLRKGKNRRRRYVSDAHRWRKVTTTLLSILFFVPFTLSFYVRGRWFVWSVITSIGLLAWLLNTLFEWHVWKQRFGISRVALVSTLALLTFIGLKWQSTIHESPNRRPWLRLTDEDVQIFVRALASQQEERQRVRLGCPASQEDICVLAAPFIDAFKRGHFFVDGDQIYRVTLTRPSAGVIVSSYGHADAFDPQDPDQGKWVKRTPSLNTIENAFAAIGVNTAGAADESLPADLLTVYFGIEPDEQTDKQRELIRKQRRQAEEELFRQK